MLSNNETTFGVAFGLLQALIVNIERRAVRAENLAIDAHIQIYVRMIVGGSSSHALEFLDADEDLFDAGVVGEVGDDA